MQVGLPTISTSPAPVAITLAVRATATVTLPAVSEAIWASSAVNSAAARSPLPMIVALSCLVRPASAIRPPPSRPTMRLSASTAPTVSRPLPDTEKSTLRPLARSMSRLPEPTNAALRRSRVVRVTVTGPVPPLAGAPQAERLRRTRRVPPWTSIETWSSASVEPSARAEELRPVVRTTR